ncbi:leucine-zipper-like transcriptional regulator 1 [Brachionus plicatilis]|uniref:Leucine-zipper-like transcriptional regulator 1 n=1 Tax=Brachionus plicatilis TaxID=10195 RepID=A0A3M7T2S1_BRAPC|nr:leucine-zipper-like transcriptional regulator 1 [Brachionus plicatilis]
MADMESRSISNYQLHSNSSIGQYLSDAVSQISPSISVSNASLASDSFQTSNSWVKMSECDEFIGPKRSKHTMVAYGNSLYVFGGDNGKQMLNDLITYDCNNNSWGRALNGSPPTPRYHHTAVVYNNSMFVFGGYTGDLNSNSNLCNKNDLYEYKFSTGNWIFWNVESAPCPRAAHGAVVYDHKLWIFAGYDGNARLNDLWYIQLNASQNTPRTWVEVEQSGEQPSTVCNFPVAVVQDAMYLFSGQSGAKTSNLLFKFDFKSSYWSKISSNFILRGTSSPPERRSGHIMVAHHNHLYIYGGFLGNSFFHDIYCFDLETKTWEIITMHGKSLVPSGRSFLAASVQSEHLYVFGGNGDQNARSNELFRFKLPNQPKSTLKDDLYKVLKKEMFCDLKLTCSNKETVLAHCAIVASRSPHFRQLIKHSKDKLKPSPPTLSALVSLGSSSSTNSLFNLEEQRKSKSPPFCLNEDEFIEIRINEENAEALKMLLEFLYTDRIVSLEGRENEIETLKLVANLYKLANQFMIPKLKNICEQFCDTSITCANVLSLLRYVDSLNLTTLKESCMKFLAKDTNFNQVIMLTEFEQLQSSLMVEIIRLRQTPRKINTTEQINEIVRDKSSCLEKDLENFLLNEIGNEFSDILIVLNENKPIFSHKCILAARCAYFEAYFRSFMPKDRKVLMTIGDTVPPRQACVSLLRYIYFDDVNMPPQDALYLFSANHFFQFSNLRLHIFCKQNLEANVSKSNVFDILEAADKIKDDNMKNFALKIVRNNFPELAHSNRIKKLSKELLLDIIADLSKLFTLKPASSAMNLPGLSTPTINHIKVSSTVSSPSFSTNFNSTSPSSSPCTSHNSNLLLHNILTFINDDSKN